MGTAPRTLIMGILNVTPDSFSDGGRFATADDAIAHGLRLVADGADWVDVGGESTRPGASRVDPSDELERVLRVVQELAAAGVAVSIDTMNASTALRAVEAGARLVNDVSGGLSDPRMLAAMREASVTHGADVALCHWRGQSSDMYARAHYDDVASEVMAELLARADAAIAAGVEASRIVLDPGIGFAKNAAQNWAVLAELPRLVASGYRVLLGTSRKRFLGALLGEDDGPARRDLATTVTSVLAAREHAWAVRVHDVESTRIALAVAGAWQSGARVDEPEESPHGQA